MGKKSRDKKLRKRIPSAIQLHESVGRTLVPPVMQWLGGVAPEASALAARAQTGSESSPDWYLTQCNRGQQLLDGGEVDQARQVFEEVRVRLGEAPSYGRAVIFGRLGRCFHMAGRPDLAVGHLRQAMAVTETLAPSEGVQGLRGTLHSELGEVLRVTGQFAEARQAYEAALKIAEELNDLRARGVDLGQLGALALAEGKFEEAMQHYRAALLLFQQLHEPAMEAVAWHQLGRIFHEKQQWDEAERHYREAARIR